MQPKLRDTTPACSDASREKSPATPGTLVPVVFVSPLRVDAGKTADENRGDQTSKHPRPI